MPLTSRSQPEIKPSCAAKEPCRAPEILMASGELEASAGQTPMRAMEATRQNCSGRTLAGWLDLLLLLLETGDGFQRIAQTNNAWRCMVRPRQRAGHFRAISTFQ